jgi:hypothetical protein
MLHETSQITRFIERWFCATMIIVLRNLAALGCGGFFQAMDRRAGRAWR